MNIHIWNPFKDHSLVLVKRLLKLMKPRAVPCRATQDGWVIVESSDKMWSTGKGNSKPLQYSRHENSMESMKRQKDMILEDEFTGSKGVQYAIGQEQRTIPNDSRKNEEAGSKQKWCSVVVALAVKCLCLVSDRCLVSPYVSCLPKQET